MTKFIKKITKTVKDMQNCVVFGKAYGHFDELVETFKTVFVLSDGIDDIRRKNIIYRMDFGDIGSLPYISAVFIDEDQLDHITKIDEIVRKYKPMVYIGTREFIPLQYSKFMNKRNYEVVEIFKESQLWKPKK